MFLVLYFMSWLATVLYLYICNEDYKMVKVEVQNGSIILTSLFKLQYAFNKHLAVKIFQDFLCLWNVSRECLLVCACYHICLRS